MYVLQLLTVDDEKQLHFFSFKDTYTYAIRITCHSNKVGALWELCHFPTTIKKWKKIRIKKKKKPQLVLVEISNLLSKVIVIFEYPSKVVRKNYYIRKNL